MKNESVNCILCGDSDEVKLRFLAAAHYSNSNDLYKYYFCSACGVLWLDRKSEITHEQYGASYYSFTFKNSFNQRVRLLIKKIIFNFWYYFGLELPLFEEYVLDRVFKKLRIKKTSRILDVGCGSGRFISQLYAFGYKNLVGIDPYCQTNSLTGPRIEKCSIENVCGEFDVINAHHVIEHTDDPKGFLLHINRLLAPGGCAIITFPRLSRVLEYDAEYSYLLQAPDHKTIFTAQCFKNLVSICHFDVIYEEFDGSGTFNWLVVGELWRKGINVMGFSPSHLKLIPKDDLSRIAIHANKINPTDAANSLFVIRKFDN